MSYKSIFMNLAAVLISLLCDARPQSLTVYQLTSNFALGYQQLEIPGFTYDYTDYFKHIPSTDKLKLQSQFFLHERELLKPLQRTALSLQERIAYDHLQYEIDFNLERIALEKAWVSEGRHTPQKGLYELKNHDAWYRFFVQRYTGLQLSVEAIMDMGKREVARVHREINRIRQQSGFKDSAAFYAYLQSDVFLLKDKASVVRAFGRTDSIIRSHLPVFIGNATIPEVPPMEWPDANANTPPGRYLNKEDSPYGKEVFQYNFYGSRYNRRAIEWLYMHEAIPGHHLQFTLRAIDDSLQQLFLYPGNFEGWGCYVEYYGKELGMYTDPYSELGKWEWDLVRSARLCIDAGIHNYGWTSKQALLYWKQEVPGQEQIADREITRVTNWTAQALSYKVGADCIEQLRRKMQAKYGSNFSEPRFHRTYLSFGIRPLQVIKQNFEAAYAANKNVRK